MKIIYILPSLTARGSSIIFEHVDRLSEKGHNVIITSLDEIKTKHDYPLTVIPSKLEDVRKEFVDADVIVGYKPVCAYFVNDLDVDARKYFMLFDDEYDYYTEEYIGQINNIKDTKLEIEYDTQKKFIDGSYKLPLRYIVSNKYMEKKLIGKKRKVMLLKYFGSVDAIKKASEEEISRVPGIRKKIARIIYESLHN